MNLSIIVCEGAHDVAFVSKILKVDQYTTWTGQPGKLPKPLGNMFIEKLKKIDLSDRQFPGYQDNNHIPSQILMKNSDIVLIYKSGGDSDSRFRLDLINEYNLLLKSPNLGSTKIISSAKIIFVYDADDSFEVRESQIKHFVENELKLSYTNIDEKYVYSKTDIYFKIFYDESCPERKGELEDLILKIIRKRESSKYLNTVSFLDSNKFTGADSDRTKEFDVCSSKYVKKTKFEEKKSIISILGQLQFSGAANGTIISKSDYIQRDDILSSKICSELLEILND